MALKRGRRTMLIAAAGVVAVLALAFVIREDILDWYVGYRFIWVPEGFEPRWGQALNSARQLVVIDSDSESGRPGGLWPIGSGEITRLRVPPGTEGCAQASAINEKGHVVGAVRERDPMLANRPFFWTRESGMQMLPSPGEGAICFYDLNDGDQAVGTCEVAGPVPRQRMKLRAILWTPLGGFRTLDGLTIDQETQADAINELGWMVGWSVATDHWQHPVLWMPPDCRPRDLGLLPGFQGGAALGVNNRGEVLVGLFAEFVTPPAPFIWTQERGYTALPVPPEYTSVFGLAINNQGMVLLKATRGSGRDEERQHFLVRSGKLMEIPQPRGARETEYIGLNDRGWLFGRARFGDSADSWRGFVAQPVR